jgi:hypothetical protein
LIRGLSGASFAAGPDFAETAAIEMIATAIKAARGPILFRILILRCSCPRLTSRHDSEPEAHIFTKPLDIVGSPGVVEEIEVEALREVGLVSREVPRMLLA